MLERWNIGILGFYLIMATLNFFVFAHYAIISVFHHSNSERSELIFSLGPFCGQLLVCLLNFFKTRLCKHPEFFTQML